MAFGRSEGKRWTQNEIEATGAEGSSGRSRVVESGGSFELFGRKWRLKRELRRTMESASVGAGESVESATARSGASDEANRSCLQHKKVR